MTSKPEKLEISTSVVISTNFRKDDFEDQAEWDRFLLKMSQNEAKKTLVANLDSSMIQHIRNQIMDKESITMRRLTGDDAL